MDVERAVDAVLSSPVGGALFVGAAHQHLGADALADPVTGTALAAIVAADLGPWRGDLPQRRRWVATHAAPRRSLVATVLADPRTTWWWAPLDRTRQLALTEPGADVTVTEPIGPAQPWEIYAQRPPGGRLETATEFPVAANAKIRSGLHAQLAADISDWNPEYPLRQTRLQVSPDARVYEMNSPNDWHHLARTYGDPATYRGSDQNLLNSAGIDHGLGPTWSAVAADWDGVHLTFGGYLTALDVPVTTDGITSTLWAWNSEQTLWLRDVFTTRDALPDVAAHPELPGLSHLDVDTGNVSTTE